MKRVVLYGGTFDPVHAGHEAAARTALEQLEADEVWFVPAARNPLKSETKTTSEDRLNMLRTVCRKDGRFKVCLEELRRAGPSYTVETLERLKEQFPDTEFIWLIGQDQAADFEHWKDPEKMLSLAQFAVVPREGAEDPRKSTYGDRFLYLDMEPVRVSSSQIRKGVRLNYLDDEVMQYIIDHELYVIPWVKPHLTPHRFAHSVSVARLSRELAEKHGLDGHKAYIIGLFHDICKDMDAGDLKGWMDALFPDQPMEHEALWHGYAAAEVVDRFYGMKDPQIKNAIHNHTKGLSYDPYAMILFIADKVDPLRGYDSSALLSAAMQDLYMGFQLVRRENKEFLKKSLQT